jgi:D-inositol-3-phosphate glycosyltransferase
LVASHDPAAWARAFEELLSDRSGLARLGRRAVRHAADFGWDRTARETLLVYGAAMADLPRLRIAVS